MIKKSMGLFQCHLQVWRNAVLCLEAYTDFTHQLLEIYYMTKIRKFPEAIIHERTFLRRRHLFENQMGMQIKTPSRLTVPMAPIEATVLTIRELRKLQNDHHHEEPSRNHGIKEKTVQFQCHHPAWMSAILWLEAYIDSIIQLHKA